ncbi:MFS general substrate transporter-like protein [Lophiotrema nucula]|uniref:MFS general substrate transporter-like protein n=1 Tax=Lophiotrema nucula TaxID=690887 RepID=A0A6A5ZBH8_9PLEO|nr:MFS general substrate transporter-like protein [Lophiotrema nucula]
MVHSAQTEVERLKEDERIEGSPAVFMASETRAAPEEQTKSSPKSSPKNWRFYLILISLSFICFLSSLDGSVIATALPQITHDLSGADNYVWIANSFLVAQTVVQPPCAQVCNIFGRRWPMIILIAVFALGSGVAGGAKDTTTMIAGRTIQGLGSGGIFMLVELIICDLVPLKERGKYLGMVMSSSAIGAIIGPVVGGALATANWRWIFYLNLPIAGVTMVIMAIFLRLRHKKETSWTSALLRIDWIGNTLFVASLCALLIGLIFGGTVFAWSSWRVVLPIVLGVIGWVGFHFYEWKPPKFCKEPSIPPHIFANRTSNAALYIDFVSAMLLQWVCFFWPIYFQGVKGTSPLRSGIYFIPFEAFLILVAAVAGGTLSKVGHYRPLHMIGFVLSIIGPGLNILLTATTPKVVWVVFQAVDAIGRAFLLPTILPAVLASLTDDDTAAATGMYSFLRSLGFVWGITIPGIIFNTQFDRYSPRISDPTVRSEMGGGRAYERVSGAYVQALPPSLRAEVISVYLKALRAVWIGAVAFGATGVLAVLVEKHIPLRTELNTQYGIEDRYQEDQEKQNMAKENNSE